MNVNQLETEIYNQIHEVIDHFSIYILTQEGNIAINESKKRRAASLVKIPILIETFRRIEQETLSLEKLLYIEEEMMVGGAGVINYLSNSHVYSYRNLLELMIIVSDNTASNVLLDTFGMGAVNQLTKSLGCEQTIIKRKFMDQQAQENGIENYTSAKDMVFLLKLISEKNDILSRESRLHIMKILSDQQFNDKLPKYLKEEDQIEIYHKTGELQGAEHDVAIMKYKNKTLYIAVLSEGLEHNANSQKHIAQIGKLLIQYIKS